MKIATAAATTLLALLLLAPSAGATSPTGFWKLYISIDFKSEGTAVNDHCFPDPEQPKPSPLTASASETATVRTARATTVEAHEAPNGVPVFGEETYSPAFRADVKVTRKSGLGGDGEPLECDGGPRDPKPACGTKTKRSGLYVSPLGGIHSWKGFTVELQETPLESFQYCQMTEAQNELADPFSLEIEVAPRKLLGHAPKLVFHGSKKLKASGRDGNTRSTATGTMSYTVKLVRTNPY
jgi:hypothetical protein